MRSAYEYFDDGILIVEDGNIVEVNHAERLVANLSEDIQLTELPDRLIVPGFIDCHVHFITGGHRLSSVQLRDASCTVLDDVQIPPAALCYVIRIMQGGALARFTENLQKIARIGEDLDAVVDRVGDVDVAVVPDESARSLELAWACAERAERENWNACGGERSRPAALSQPAGPDPISVASS